MINLIIGIVVFLLAWAFFAGSETALISIDRIKLRHFIKRGNKSAKIVKFLIEKPERLLTIVLVGTNISLVFTANLTARLFYELFQKPRPFSSVLSITLISLIICEIIPKNFALKNNLRFSLIASHPLYISYIILYPVIKALSFVTKVLIRLVGIPYTGFIPQLFSRKDDVKIFFKAHLGKKISEEHTRYFVDSLDFGEKRVSDILIPLVEMVALPENSCVEDAILFVKHHKKSIIPVYTERIDNIIGIVFPKALFKVSRKTPINEIMVEPYFVPETKSISTLYREMYLKDIQVVFAVDEHGGVTGLATLYDIGEEIIGKISTIDEKKKLIVKIREKEFLCDGDVEIEEINNLLNIDITPSGFTTLNGFLVKELGRIPKTGDFTTIQGYRFIVEKSSKKRAELIKVIPDISTVPEYALSKKGK